MDDQLCLNYGLMKDALIEASNVLLISHRGPDGDTVGTNVALRLWLERLGKNVDSACVDLLPSSLDFLPYSKNFLREFSVDDYDCIVIIDCGSLPMVAFDQIYPDLMNFRPLINFDHHPSNDHFGSINVVEVKAAAAAVMMYRFLRFCKVEFDVQIAKALLTGIYFDTGCFMHSNVDKEVLSIAADLMTYGVRGEKIADHIFRTHSVNQLKLWGMILERARLNKDQIMVSMVTQDELNQLGLSNDDLSGVIDFLSMVPEGKFSLLLSEDSSGNIRGSCRTKSEVIDLSKVAGLFGGGGHKKAAGFSIKGSISEDLV